MKNKSAVFGSKGIIFFALPTLAAVGLTLTGCKSGAEESVPIPPDHGGEQGLEPGNLDLPKDTAAAKDALNGWYANAKSSLDQRMEWYRSAKFGCFVHWGPYSRLESRWNGTAYNGYAEHIQRMAKIPAAVYKEQAVKEFNPSQFNAGVWMDQVQAAGMKYFVITAKHHDGFALWPSAYTPAAGYPSYGAGQSGYDIRMTKFPQNRDLMMELRDAARARGIKFGFYYSHAFDWEHPYAPGNDWDDFSRITNWASGRNPGGDSRANYGGDAWWKDAVYQDFLPVANNYVKDKAIKQVQELIDKYEPDIMWFDTPHKLPLYQNIAIAKAVRTHAKGADIVINGRLASWTDTALGAVQLGDYENSGDRAAFLFPLEGDWESIPTTNESYGRLE